MQVDRRRVANHIVELWRCGAAGRAVGGRVNFSTCVAAARWRGGGSHLLRVAGNFAQNTGRWRRLLVLRCRLRSGCADWVVLGHGTNVTRVTRGENIFNNKIYVGDLASTYDVRCPAAKYRGEYQEVSDTQGSLPVTSVKPVGGGDRAPTKYSPPTGLWRYKNNLELELS